MPSPRVEMLPLGEDSEEDELDALIGRIEGSRIENQGSAVDDDYF